MSFWTPPSLRSATGGSWLHRPTNDEMPPIAGLGIDSRTLPPERAFLAIRGERFDGHDFLTDACARGARLLIVDRADAAASVAEAYPDTWILKVADTRAALMKLAATYRRTLESTRVIAITGSNGKTTTTRLIDAVLSDKFRGSASIKSFNNDIGVPLTILNARPADQYLICEVGTNSPGEIEPLARVIEPDIGVITTIGRAHIEHFGTKAAIAREKAMLLSYIRPGGTAIVSADASELTEFVRPIPNVVTFGRHPDADLRLTSFEHDTTDDAICSHFTVNDRASFPLALYGEHNAYNALAAVAAGRRFGLEDHDIARGLESVRSADMRLQRESIGGVDVFNDAYNASPESMIAAIRTFASLTQSCARRVIILGDMLELGDAAPAAHQEVADAILDADTIDEAITVGAAALYTADRLSQHWPQQRISMHSNLDDAQAARIASRIKPGDAVLIKGSRAMQLERVVDALRRVEGAGAH